MNHNKRLFNWKLMIISHFHYTSELCIAFRPTFFLLQSLGIRQLIYLRFPDGTLMMAWDHLFILVILCFIVAITHFCLPLPNLKNVFRAFHPAVSDWVCFYILQEEIGRMTLQPCFPWVVKLYLPLGCEERWRGGEYCRSYWSVREQVTLWSGNIGQKCIQTGFVWVSWCLKSV